MTVGPSTWMSLAWGFSKQTSPSNSTTEAAAFALVYSLPSEAFPVCELLNMLLGRKVLLRINEDNTATINVLKRDTAQHFATFSGRTQLTLVWSLVTLRPIVVD